jgi:amino-acid N-acetyltransferase
MDTTMNHSSAVEVSTATRAELSDVLALVHECELLETGVAEAIESFVVARAKGSLIGCAGLEVYGALGLLRSVAVRASTRGAGVGSELVARITAAARAQGLRELFLLTTTASQFFERRGFQTVKRAALPPEIAESWEFRVGCPQTALPMRLSLRSS